jgi:alpha-tubulin suppressor-like RCC1 family protein
MTDSPRPVPVGAGLDGIIQVAAGSLYTCALRNSGPVLCWGGHDRVWGSSTNGSPIQGTASATQIAAGGAACARLADGTMTCFGSNGAVPWSYTSFSSSAPVAGLNGIAEARVGAGNFDAWMSDGTLQTLGSNDDGQLGVDMHFGRSNPAPVAGLDHIVRLAVGPQHSCALRSDGSLWCWGENYYGQVGTGSTSNDPTRVPTQVAR